MNTPAGTNSRSDLSQLCACPRFVYGDRSRERLETQGGDFYFEWEKTGGPMIVAPPQAAGFGSEVTERSITGHLGGKIEYDLERS